MLLGTSHHIGAMQQPGRHARKELLCSAESSKGD